MQNAEPPPQPPPKEGSPGDSNSHTALQSARLKLSVRDQEAMRYARLTIIDGSDSTSISSSPRSPHFPTAPRQLQTKRSTLSKHLDIMDQLPPDSESSTTIHVQRADYVVAIVGHEGVGKSTIIQRAIKTWGGSSPVVTYTPEGHPITSCFSDVQAGGKLQSNCKVEFVEVNLRALDLSGVSGVWPSTMSPVSGAIFCYDAERQDTLRGLSEALHLLSPGLPMVLFACKSDPDRTLEVDAHAGDSIGHPYNIGLIEVTTATSQGKSKMRTGLRWLLYRLEQRRRRGAQQAETSIMLDTGQPSSVMARDAFNTDSDASADHGMWTHSHDITGIDDVSDTRSSSSSLGWMMKLPMPLGTAFTESAESAQTTESAQNGGSSPIVESVPTTEVLSPTKTLSDSAPYVSIQDLLNQLFSAIVSTENEQFVDTFFMTYRRFCHPWELIKEFFDRLKEVEQYAVAKDIKLWALMKLAGALIVWTSKYPGDLVDEQAQVLFRAILSLMLKYTFMAHLTVELVQVEASLLDVQDIDASWSLRSVSPLTTPFMNSPATDLVIEQDVHYEMVSREGTPDKGRAPSTRSLSTSSLSVDVDPNRSLQATDSVSVASKSIHSTDDMGYHRWAGAVGTIVNMDAHHFALELTRMQWELFGIIRPRDVFRHDFGKERDDPVGRSIAFFNHLSRWVSTMVLANPKAKHRARVFEAFVRIAHQLRRLNNYDSLYAVVSGLRETSIHRLRQTHHLVRLDPALSRDFQSHLKLMDPRGGYIHYRRALQADMAHGRAAIPLLTTVLGLVNRLQVVRPEDRRPDGSIQWDKFARFGEILAVIPECQAKGSMIAGPVTPSFRRIIEDTPVITNEDGLFERSRMLEPGPGGGGIGGQSGGGMLRKLANLGL